MTTPTPPYPSPRSVSPARAARAGNLPVEDVRRPPPRLWRSRSKRVIAGVLGGLAEKFGWDAKPVRLLYGLMGVLTLPLASLPVVIPYVWLWVITQSRGPAARPRPFRRSRTNQVVAGVLAGIAERLQMRPWVVRTLYSVLTVATALLPGIIAYLVLWAKTPATEFADDDAA